MRSVKRLLQQGFHLSNGETRIGLLPDNVPRLCSDCTGTYGTEIEAVWKKVHNGEIEYLCDLHMRESTKMQVN